MAQYEPNLYPGNMMIDHTPTLSFWDNATGLLAVPTVKTPHIPRVGEYVYLASEEYEVRAIRYLWPVDDSPAERRGERGPLVDIRVSLAQPFFRP